MPAQELSGTTALVTGASRGFGRATAADAADPVVASQLLDKHRLRTLVLNAGAAPLPRPVHRQTWQTFSRNWEVDVQHVFNWTRGAQLLPCSQAAQSSLSPAEPRSTAAVSTRRGSAPSRSPVLVWRSDHVRPPGTHAISALRVHLEIWAARPGEARVSTIEGSRDGASPPPGLPPR
jgi:NAD(P)-dependent dehydrogenase (short-subunit alcohol dehydrogenase family)